MTQGLAFVSLRDTLFYPEQDNESCTGTIYFDPAILPGSLFLIHLSLDFVIRESKKREKSYIKVIAPNFRLV